MTGVPPQNMDWDELLGPAGDPQDTVDEVKRSLGIGVLRRRYDGPDLRLQDLAGSSPGILEDSYEEDGTYHD